MKQLRTVSNLQAREKAAVENRKMEKYSCRTVENTRALKWLFEAFAGIFRQVPGLPKPTPG